MMLKNTKFNYRPGTVADTEELMQLSYVAYQQFATELAPEHWTIFESNLLNAEMQVQLMAIAKTFVCTYSNAVIGVAYLVPSGNPTDIFDTSWSYIRKVGVHPGYRGHGIAKQLTQMCIDNAIANGEKMIALHTSEFMDTARHIYESMGFVKQKEIAPLYGKRYWLYLLEL